MQATIILPVWAFVLVILASIGIGAMIAVMATSISKKSENTTHTPMRTRQRVNHAIRRAAARFKPSSTFWTAHHEA